MQRGIVPTLPGLGQVAARTAIDGPDGKIEGEQSVVIRRALEHG